MWWSTSQMVPLPRRFQARMGVRFLARHGQWPPLDRPRPKLPWPGGHLGAEQCWRREPPSESADQHPANGHRRHARVLPHRGRRDELHHALLCAVPSAPKSRVPARRGIGQERHRGRTTLTVQTWSAILPQCERWSGLREGRLQTPARNTAEGLCQLRQLPQQRDAGKAPSGDEYQRAPRHQVLYCSP
jgi:hypothetical protein